MNNYFIILGAGKGRRFGQYKPKQYHKYKGKLLIQHSIDKALQSKLFKKIIIVVSKKYKPKINPKNGKIIYVAGGIERKDSCLNALEKVKKLRPTNVLIHDAARPNFSIKLLKSLIKHLKTNIAVVPFVKSKDSIKYKIEKKYINLNRNNICLTQTPQAFRFKNLYELAKKQKNKITDESSLYLDRNIKVKFINGDYYNEKITFLEDLKIPKTYFGIGFDIHRLEKNKKLYLGGIKIPFHSGLKGHSDGDVILHSIIDALLGAKRKMDIGTFFPSDKNKYKNIRSINMLKPILKNLSDQKYFLNNLDINLICEKPKVSIYRKKIIKSLTHLLDIDANKINIKGKTVEKLGLIGKEKAIACETIISITRYE